MEGSFVSNETYVRVSASHKPFSMVYIKEAKITTTINKTNMTIANGNNEFLNALVSNIIHTKYLENLNNRKIRNNRTTRMIVNSEPPASVPVASMIFSMYQGNIAIKSTKFMNSQKK